MDETIVIRGDTSARPASASPSPAANPENPAEPGLIGPIGYDVSK